jgi:ribonuclease P protein component
MLGRLTKRPEFLAARKGARATRPLVSIEAFARDPDDPLIRVGFTATKRIGNAVIRNRAKRRLREAARQLVPSEGLAGCDYVLIARDETASAPWGALLDDLRSALIRLRPALAAAQQARKSAGTSPRNSSQRARSTDRLKDE